MLTLRSFQSDLSRLIIEFRPFSFPLVNTSYSASEASCPIWGTSWCVWDLLMTLRPFSVVSVTFSGDRDSSWHSDSSWHTIELYWFGCHHSWSFSDTHVLKRSPDLLEMLSDACETILNLFKPSSMLKTLPDMFAIVPSVCRSLLDVFETPPIMTSMRHMSPYNHSWWIGEISWDFSQHGYLKLFIWLLELFLSYRSSFLTCLRLSAFLENLPDMFETPSHEFEALALVWKTSLTYMCLILTTCLRCILG